MQMTLCLDCHSVCLINAFLSIHLNCDVMHYALLQVKCKSISRPECECVAVRLLILCQDENIYYLLSAAINRTVNWQPHAMKMVVSVNEASV